MHHTHQQDIDDVASIQAIPTILNIVCRTTGMRFAAVARVTENRWVACSVRDDIAFGLVQGGELPVETTICREIRATGQAVVIDHVAADPRYAQHPTPRLYGLQSYISAPIRLADGSFFGTLCAIDPEPRRINTPETIEMFAMFADMIGNQLSTLGRLKIAEAGWLDERNTAALREQFIAVLGHDLRNPLAAIGGGMRLLQKTPLDARALQITGMVQSSVDRMARLIDDVMDFTRTRLGGGLTLNRNSRAALAPLLLHIVAECQTSAPDRKIETHIDVPQPVNCDAQRIGQLLSNLLANAVAYGAPATPIVLSAQENTGWLEVFVANTGAPIPPAALPNLFQPFSRAAARPQQEGLGLGLFIAQSIARAHGGVIDVASTPAETRFTFRMPLAES